MRRRVYLACFVLHFTIIGMVCLDETVSLLAKHLTIVPSSFDWLWNSLDKVSTSFPGKSWTGDNPARWLISTYTNATGIEAGYGYFAPNIPSPHALVFECHYPDGQVDYQIPTVRGEAAQLRLTTFIEQIGRTDYDRWRIELIKLLARSTWQRNPEVVSMRVFLGTITPPTAAEYRVGRQERTFNTLSVYDFRREASKGGQLSR